MFRIYGEFNDCRIELFGVYTLAIGRRTEMVTAVAKHKRIFLSYSILNILLSKGVSNTDNKSWTKPVTCIHTSKGCEFLHVGHENCSAHLGFIYVFLYLSTAEMAKYVLPRDSEF